MHYVRSRIPISPQTLMSHAMHVFTQYNRDWEDASTPSHSTYVTRRATILSDCLLPGVLGVPAGAIVGAPGSAPPPGMKLAGYVTMAGPAPSSPMASMGSMMNPMMAASMMRNPMMSGSMPMRFPIMPPGSLGPLGGLGPMGGMSGLSGMGSMGNMGSMSAAMNSMSGMNGMSGMGPMGSSMGPMGGSGMMPPGMGGMGGLSPQALSQIFGPTFAQQAAQVLGQTTGKTGSTGSGTGSSASPTTSSTSGQGSQTSASNSTPSRSRFLSRLNPLNLFRRLRSRAQASKSSAEDKVVESMLASESNPVPVKKGFSFLKRSDNNSNFIATNSSEDRIAAENFPLPVPHLFYRNAFVQPLFRFESPSSFQFPRRRGRRVQEAGPRFLDALTSDVGSSSSNHKNTGMMGSGNFEVIRGGLLPNADKADGDKSSVLDDDQQFFSAGRPAVMGFQGFNHFAATAPIYNSLASDSKPVHDSPPIPTTDTGKTNNNSNNKNNNAIMNTLSSVASLLPLVGH